MFNGKIHFLGVAIILCDVILYFILHYFILHYYTILYITINFYTLPYITILYVTMICYTLQKILLYNTTLYFTIHDNIHYQLFMCPPSSCKLPLGRHGVALQESSDCPGGKPTPPENVEKRGWEISVA